jgi:exoribonuclease-2
VELAVGADGTVRSSDIYQARARNRAQLAYKSVAAWLEGSGAIPNALAAVGGLVENVRAQDRIAHEAKLGPIELSVKEKETVNIPMWAGVGAMVIGGALLLVGGKKG